MLLHSGFKGVYKLFFENGHHVFRGGQLDDLGPSNFAFSLMTRSGPVKHPLILVGGRPRASAQWFKGGL